jgi:hypothetical protein
MARFVSSSLLFLYVLLASQPLAAQLPLARLLTVFPPGGKVGTQTELSVTGADLDEASQLHFSHPAITSKQKLGTNDLPEPNKFLVTIPTNVPPGSYEARVVGRFGISNPRSFVVSDLPQSIAPSTNNSARTAATVSVPSIIHGHSLANAASFYKFPAKKSQRILIECEAREIDSRMLAALVLYDAAGKELERNRRGGLLDFTPPADGEYVLKLYDFLFRGGDEYFYSLAISTGPHIDFIFPPSGLAGIKGKFMLYGRNLPGAALAKDLAIDGKPLEQLEVEIQLPAEPTRHFSSLQKPADATLDAFEYRLSTAQGVSNPVLLSFATGPVVAEQQPNDQPAQAQNIAPPCEYVGQFYPAGDRDWVTFEAKKGDAFWVEAFSERLGLPTDPFILIRHVSKNDKGEEQISDVKELNDTDFRIGAVEYKTSTRDPSGLFEAEADGVYRIEVRDLFNTSKADPSLVYRLCIRKENPDFRLVAAPQPPPSPNKDAREAVLWTPMLRRGETMPIKVMAFRRDNFNGDIALKAEALPTGVACNEATIERDKSSTTLLLTAAENAATWVGVVKIIGKAKIAGAEVAREARGATLNWTVNDYNNEAIESRLSRDLVLAVSGVESAPVSIESSENKLWVASEGEKMKIPIKLTRRGEFNANLKLKAAGIGALDKLKEIELDGNATNATIDIDLKEFKIAAGTHSFYLQTQTSGKYRNNPEAARAAEEALKQAEKSVVDLADALKKAPDVKQAAIKAAADSAVKAKAASASAIAAAQAAAATETFAKAASEKLAAAKTALEAKSDDQALLAAKDAAAKASEEAAAKSKAALETKLAAEKAAMEAQAKARADAEAQVAAEKAELELPGKLKAAEQGKDFASTRAKETAKTAEPRDVTITVYSAPINLKIAASLAASSK